ncbi:MAG: glycosyltransferase family 2 protein [Nitrospirae bacterium]|nr:glycosyltransferase family 2 protein [Nitrospirota bacterium]
MIYILLPVHNRVDETRKFLSCLKEQTCGDYHLILVDDGCTDGTAEYAAREIRDITVLRGDGNLWWAGSLQKARKHLLGRADVSEDDIVLIANDDITFGKDFLCTVQEEARIFPQSLILARCHDQTTHELLDKGMNIDWKSFSFASASAPDDINVLSTRGLFMTFRVFCAVGGFHPLLLPHYGSDYEFTHRAFKKGFHLAIAERAAVYLNRETTGTRSIDYRIGLLQLLNNLFVSKRSTYNRLMWTIFILLSSDRQYIIRNLCRLYIDALAIVYQWAILRLRGERT